LKPNIKRQKNPAEYTWTQGMWLLFILLHIGLALAFNSFRMLSTIHAITTLVIGVTIVLTTRSVNRIAWVTAYIAGAEILWRMTEAQVFWEYGKYAIVFLMVITMFRLKKISNAGLPILYFVLLAVSIPLTLFNLNLSIAREAISSNLSGPLSLAVCTLFFTQVSLNQKDREVLIWYIVTPVMGIASLCLRGIITAEELEFTPDSSFVTSGGFGPNQVSAILGLGALMLILLAVMTRAPNKRWLPLSLSLGLITLSSLTFSRGGLYNLFAALAILGVFSLRNKRLRRTFIPILIIGIAVGGFLLFPRLDDFTEGMLKVRYADTSTTGRIELIEADLDIFRAHPVLGVGPGMSPIYRRSVIGMQIAAHTEYSRLLAEHGIMGGIALVILALISIKNLFRTQSGIHQSWTAALFTWSLMEMTHAAMRISAIGFIFGLAVAAWKENEDPTSSLRKNATPIHR